MRKLLIGLVLCAGSAYAAGALHCKYDQAILFWNGGTRVSPVSTIEYKCVCGAGHAYWLDKADCSE